MQIMQVDPFDPGIRQQIVLLQKICLPHDTPLDPDEKSYWWLAEDAGDPVGFASLSWSRRWSDTGYLSRAGVVPKARGYGLQKRLIRVRVQKAKRMGMNWLITDTTANPASSNSLIACGFKLFEPTVPWAYKHSLYWRLKIGR